MKVSIVTVTYNSEKTLRETFESVLLQSHRPLQYVIVDGLSSDSTMDIVSEYETKFFNAGIEFFYRSEADEGISDAFNKGIQRADGDLIGIINSDDMLCEGALDLLEKEFQDEIDVYYGQCVIFNDQKDERYVATPKHDLNRLRWIMAMYHPACFVNKRAYQKYGAFDTDLKYCMDRELMLRFYINGCKFQMIESPLACYREGGVNQKYYKKNLLEGTQISIKYGMNPVKAYALMGWKYIKNFLWRTIKAAGAEKLIHKKVSHE